MILRLWRGQVAADRAAEYRSYQSEVGPPNYRTIEGNRGVLMLGRDVGSRYEIVMASLWDSWEAIRAFAGEPVERARYYDRDREFLIDPPENVEHFEVLEAHGWPGTGS